MKRSNGSIDRVSRPTGRAVWTAALPSRFARLLLALLLMAAGHSSSYAAPRIESPQIGVEGLYKVGTWTPLQVTVVAGDDAMRGVRLSITTLDGDGVEVRYAEDETFDVAAGAQRTVARLVKLGRVKGSLTIRLLQGDRELARRHLPSGAFPLPQLADRRLFLTLGPSIGLEPAARRLASRERLIARRLTDPGVFPEHWLALEGVEVIAVATSDPSTVEGLSARQFAALEAWVQLGGHLVLSVGARGREIFVGPADEGIGRLARFCPGTFEDLLPLRDGSSLETYASVNERLELSPPAPVTWLKDVRGSIEISDTGVRGFRPLVVAHPYGLGQVTFVGFDLDQPPFADWLGRPRLVERLFFHYRGFAASARERKSHKKIHAGYQDLAGQLRAGMDQFTDVTFVPFYWIASLVFLYMLMIGPGDFFLVRRFLPSMAWTWVTFPAAVVLFGLLAWTLRAQLKASPLRVNQLDIVDVDTVDGVMRGSTWAHLYSPRTHRYDLRAEVGPAVRPLQEDEGGLVLSWHGLPGDGLRGLNTTFEEMSFSAPYRVSRDAGQGSMHQTPIQIAATKALAARWWNRTRMESETALRRDDDRLAGDVANPLPFALSDCMVAFENWLYRLDSTRGVLAPGQKIRIELENSLNLEWRLTRRRVVQSKDLTTTWNEHDLNVPRIVEMMMFHDAAGGRDYTDLTHRFQPYLDLTRHLYRGRAILIGRARHAATALELDGEAAADHHDRSWTYYRVIFPVAGSRRQVRSVEEIPVPKP